MLTIHDSSDYYKLREQVITIHDRYVIAIHDNCYYNSRRVLQSVHDNCYYNSRQNRRVQVEVYRKSTQTDK